MSLRFILGRAGTGKTHACLEAIRSAARAAPEGPPLVLLVPEQATFQMEQALLGPGGLPGMIRVQVLSFRRLAWRVSMLTVGLACPPLSDLGKRMVLRALLERRRDDLRVFGRVADRPGFIDKLARTLGELRSYGVEPEHLEAQLDALAREGQDQTAMGAKLHDLALVMAELRSYTAGRYTDPDEYLSLLSRHLHRTGLLTGAEVWVDSFSGFTPQELEVLGAILTAARRVYVALCLDPDDLERPRGPTDLFHLTLATYDRILALAGERGVPVEPPLILRGEGTPPVPPRFRRAPELAFLERHFFRPGAPPRWEGPVRSLTLVSAQNRREEVAAAAREVLRLVREEGLRYREAAVVTRNLDAYADLVATVFAEHGIPVFIDRRRSVAHHPLVELLRSALEVVIHHWAYAPVFRFLKTDLVPVSRDEVDILENYVLEHGIRGSRWYDGEPWRYVRRYTLDGEEEPAGQEAVLERVNGIRRRAVAALAAFQQRLAGRGGRRRTVREITAALWELLHDLEVAARLEEWRARAEAEGDLEGAREHGQVWQGVLHLMDEMVAALGDLEMSLPEYLNVLSAGLDGLRPALIPPGLDQVVVGTVERSRHQGVRAVLVLGATDRDFPPAPPEDSILSDAERERLQRGGLELGPTSQVRLFQEQYFTYVALTRGSERLWLSYPLADEDGRAIAPSPVVRRLTQMFPTLRPVAAGGEAADGAAAVAAIATPAHLGAALARALRLHRSGYPLHPVWLDLYQWVVTDPDLRDRLAPTLASLRYEEAFAHRTAPLGPDLARALYGAELTASASRLEAFAACPFLHFAGYGLGLRPRPQFRVEAPEMGLFYHAALSMFVRRLLEEGKDWADLTPEEAAARMDQVVDELAPRLQSEILLSSPQYRYLLRVLRRTLHQSLRYLNEHVYRGRFRPLWVELPFGEEAAAPVAAAGPAQAEAAAAAEAGTPAAAAGTLPPAAAALPPVAVPLPEGGSVLLRGRVDRVDGVQGPDGVWHLRVLDYKSGARNLDLARFCHGLSLQLILYLHAVLRHAPRVLGGPVRPAGALYFPVHDPIEPLPVPEPPERVAERRRKRYQARGLVVADPEVIRWMDPGGGDLIGVRLNKDGSLRRGSPAATPEQFGLLFAHLERMLVRLAAGMLAGEVAVAPAKLGGEAPCRFCPFRSVCQFDPAVPGQGYRTLPDIPAHEVWAYIGQGGGADG